VLYREIIAVWSEIHTKHINALCEQNIEFLNVKAGGAVTKLNSILWDRDVTPKTKTHIFPVIFKSTITYATETWCLKAKKP
jgi:hypothetical protein